jgi:Protein of unknown function (DUF2892)
MIMLKNIGDIDRTLRIIFGAALILIGIIFQSWWGLIGILPIATALIRWCPAYMPFKFSTVKKDAAAK